jgi:PAS domain S-box-containing protein
MGNLVYWMVASTVTHRLDGVLPMPPFTGLAFLFLALACAARLVWPDARWPRPALLVLGGLAVVTVSLHLLPLGVAWEAILDPAQLTFLGRPAGQTRLPAIVLVALTTFTLGAVLLTAPGSRWWRIGVVVAGASALLGFLTLVADTAGNPMFAGAGLLGVTPPTALAFLLLNAGLVSGREVAPQLRIWILGPEAAGATPAHLRNDRLALQFLAVLGCVALVAVLYLRLQTREQREEMGQALIADAGLKAAQVAKWRQERAGDALTIWVAPWYREIASALAASGLTAAQRAEHDEVAESFRQVYRYRRETIFDRAMKPVYWYPDEPDLAAEPLQGASQPGFDGRIQETPITLDRDGALLWGYLIRIRLREADETGAYILLHADVRELFPYLRVWPRGNVTGQTLLWTIRGNQLHGLGGLRDTRERDAAFRQPFAVMRSLDDAKNPLARIARGEAGWIEGKDEDGNPLLFAGRRVPGSDWVITSTMRSWEVYAALRRTSWRVVGFSALVLALVGLVATRFWRDQQQQLVRERLLADLERKHTAARLGTIMNQARDVIIVVDEELRIIEINQQAAAVYGWTREELLGRTVLDLRAPETAIELPELARAVFSGSGATYETIHRRKDGGTFAVEVSTRMMQVDGRKQGVAIIRDISERKRAEAELRATQERYRLIAEHTSDVISLIDLKTGHYIYTSPSVENALGWRPDEVIGRPFGGFSEPGVRQQIAEQLAAFNAGDPSGRMRRLELELRHKNGSRLQVEILATILPGADGRGEPVLGVIRDMTERRRAEAELRASELRYRLLAENTSDVIWMYNLVADGFTYASPSTHVHLGYRPEEIVGRKLTFLLPPDGAEKATAAVAAELQQAEAGQRRYINLEIDQLHKDGRLVPTEVVATVLRDAAGRPVQLLGVTRDITERKRAREALEKFNTELEQRVAERTSEIQALLDAIPDTVLLCDERGEIVFAHADGNPAITRLALGDLPSDSRAPFDVAVRGIVPEMRARALAAGAAVVQEFERVLQEGKPTWLEARAVPMPGGRVLVLLREISERKQHELGVLANLEREKQLSALKSQFLSVASHEFRTPLAAAVGTLDLLERHGAKLAETKRVELVTRAQHSLARLSQIMNDVLQLSRADSGRVTAARINTDLVRLAQDTVHEVERGDTGNHRFVFEATGGPATVPVDTNLTNHVLLNLLDNAARYSPIGTTVTVRLHIDATDFTFTIADEGIGIPPAEREQVFEPFARGSNVGQISGTGLGLNIVRRYTELMGGRIRLLPTEHGSTFEVRIPLVPPPKD